MLYRTTSAYRQLTQMLPAHFNFSAPNKMMQLYDFFYLRSFLSMDFIQIIIIIAPHLLFHFGHFFKKLCILEYLILNLRHLATMFLSWLLNCTHLYLDVPLIHLSYYHFSLL